jgi:hypothetical protein
VYCCAHFELNVPSLRLAAATVGGLALFVGGLGNTANDALVRVR